MIERVAQHQSRFRTPGLSPDVRGVALGPLGVVPVPSMERLVALLGSLGEDGALDELLDALRIVQVISPLRTRELLAEVQSGTSHRMDRPAAIARQGGGRAHPRVFILGCVNQRLRSPRREFHVDRPAIPDRGTLPPMIHWTQVPRRVPRQRPGSFRQCLRAGVRRIMGSL